MPPSNLHSVYFVDVYTRSMPHLGKWQDHAALFPTDMGNGKKKFIGTVLGGLVFLGFLDVVENELLLVAGRGLDLRKIGTLSASSEVRYSESERRKCANSKLIRRNSPSENDITGTHDE